MAKVLTIGEAMGLLIACRPGDLAEVEQFSRHVCGAELNYAVGMARLGHDLSLIHIYKKLRNCRDDSSAIFLQYDF